MIHETSNIVIIFSGKDLFWWRESLVLLQSQLSQPFPQSPTFRTANVGVVKKHLYRQKTADNLFRKKKFESSDEGKTNMSPISYNQCADSLALLKNTNFEGGVSEMCVKWLFMFGWILFWEIHQNTKIALITCEFWANKNFQKRLEGDSRHIFVVTTPQRFHLCNRWFEIFWDFLHLCIWTFPTNTPGIPWPPLALFKSNHDLENQTEKSQHVTLGNLTPSAKQMFGSYGSLISLD